MNHTYIKKMALIGVLIGTFVILSTYLSISAYNIKFTFQNLPLFIGAIIFGPTEGFLIGFIGMFLNQMLMYGFSYTIFLWCLPQAIAGYLLGYIMKKYSINIGSGPRFWIIIIMMHLLITLLNTLVMYIDSIIMGYYSFVYVFGAFIIRILVSIVTGIIYSCVIPLIVRIIRPFME